MVIGCFILGLLFFAGMFALTQFCDSLKTNNPRCVYDLSGFRRNGVLHGVSVLCSFET